MATNRGLDYFNRGRPLDVVAGQSATTGLAYFDQGQVFAVVLTAASTGATGTVTGATLPLTGSTITGTAGASDTGTVSGATLPLTGSTITAPTGVDATGTVSGATLPLTGSTIRANNNWVDLGQDSVIAGNSATFARQIRQLTIWDGVVWLGHGDVADTPRPLYGRYWDPSDSSFHTIANQSGGFETDGLNTHFLYGSDLWLPYNDPTGTGDYAVVTSKTTASVEVRSTPDTEHFWWLVEFNGDLYAAGGDNAAPGYEAAVWKSTDDGANWSVVYEPDITNGNWFTCIFVLDSKLWVEAYNGTSGQRTGNARWSSDGSTWNDAGYAFASATPPVMKAVNFKTYALLRSTSISTNSGKLARFDATGQGTDISGSIATETGIQGPIARDVCVHNDVAYALGTNRVSISLDGSTWGVIAELLSSETAMSIAVDDDWIYLGTKESHLWRTANPVATVDPATLILNGSTITGTAGQGATGVVSGATLPLTGSTITGTVSVTGTVTGATLPLSGSTVTGTADASGTVTGTTLPLTGSTITGTAGTSIDATGTVAGASLPLTGSAINATTGQGATGTVSGATLPLSGSAIAGTAGASASVTGATLPLSGSTITGTAGQSDSAAVSGVTLPLSGSVVTGTTGQGDTGTVAGITLPLTGSTITGDVFYGPIGPVTFTVDSVPFLTTRPDSIAYLTCDPDSVACLTLRPDSRPFVETDPDSVPYLTFTLDSIQS